MKALIVLIGLVVLSVPLSATLIAVDPDEFAAGTDKWKSYVTLSSGGGGVNLDGKVYAAFQSGSTGNMVFANSRTSNKLWLNNETNSCYYLLVEFAENATSNHVWIDVIANTSGDRPCLWYTTVSGNTVKLDYPTSILSLNQVFTCNIQVETDQIKTIRIGGYGTTSTNAVLLDNLRFEIPEPATCLFLLSGWLLLKTRKK